MNDGDFDDETDIGGSPLEGDNSELAGEPTLTTLAPPADETDGPEYTFAEVALPLDSDMEQELVDMLRTATASGAPAAPSAELVELELSLDLSLSERDTVHAPGDDFDLDIAEVDEDKTGEVDLHFLPPDSDDGSSLAETRDRQDTPPGNIRPDFAMTDPAPAPDTAVGVDDEAKVSATAVDLKLAASIEADLAFLSGDESSRPVTSPPAVELARHTVVPTTVPPPTVAPTTVAPTTVAPTTVAPTTVAPTTVAPTTVAPPTVPTPARTWSSAPPSSMTSLPPGEVTAEERSRKSSIPAAPSIAETPLVQPLRSPPKKRSAPDDLRYVGTDERAVRARLEYWEQLAANCLGPERARVCMLRAEGWVRLGDPLAAERACHEALDAHPTSLSALRMLRRIALQRRNFSDATELLSREVDALTSKRNKALALELQARIFRESGPEVAHETALRSLRVDASIPAAALALSTASDPAAERSRLLADVASSWNDPRAQAAVWLDVAGDEESADDYLAAKRAFGAAAEADPECLAAWLGMARTGSPSVRRTAFRRLAEIVDGTALGCVFKRLEAVVAAGQGQQSEVDWAGVPKREAALRTALEGAIDAGESATALLAELAAKTKSDERALWLALSATAAARGRSFEEARNALRACASVPGAESFSSAVRLKLSTDFPALGSVSATSDAAEPPLSAAARAARDGQAALEHEQLAIAAESEKGGLVAQVLLVDALLEMQHPAAETAYRRSIARLDAGPRSFAVLALAELNPGLEAAYAGEALEAFPSVQALSSVTRAGVEAEPNAVLDLASGKTGSERVALLVQAARTFLSRGNLPQASSALDRALLEIPGETSAFWAREALASSEGGDGARRFFEAQIDGAQDVVTATGFALALLAADLEKHELSPTVVEKAMELVRRGDAVELALPSLMRSFGVDFGHYLRFHARASETSPHVDVRRREGVRAGFTALALRDFKQAAALFSLAERIQPDRVVSLAAELAELSAGRPDRFIARSLARTDGLRPEQRADELEELAVLDLRMKGDVASAALAARAVLEERPQHLGALRLLQRHEMTGGTGQSLLEVELDLIDALPAADLPAEARTAVRLNWQADSLSMDSLFTKVVRRLQTEQVLPDDEWLLRVLSHTSNPAQRSRFRVARARMSEASSIERVGLWLDAADSVADVDGPAAAAELVERAIADGLPRDALLDERRTRWLRDSGDTGSEALAESLMHTAQLSEGAHALSMFYDAARMYEAAGRDDEALRAYDRVTTLELLFRDAFQRHTRLLQKTGDNHRLDALYRRRIGVGGEPAVLADLETSRAEAALSRGALDDAVEALTAASAHEPGRVAVLKLLAQTLLAAKRWKDAAETLIKVARLKQERHELHWVFFQLGDIYFRHLPDSARAETALKRALQLEPQDEATGNLLAEFYEANGKWDLAAEVIDRLRLDAVDEDVRRSCILRLASVWERSGDLRAAERVLDEARRHRPCDMLLIDAFRSFYLRQNASGALAMHLGRAANCLREKLSDGIEEVEHWENLSQVYAWRGDRAAASVVAAAASSVGLASVALDGYRLGLVGAGQRVLTADVLSRLGERDLLRAGEILRSIQHAADGALPFDVKHLKQYERSSADVDRATELLGVSKVTVYESHSIERAIVPGSQGAKALLVHPEHFGRLSSQSQRVFAIVRACILLELGFAPVFRMPGAGLAALAAGARAALGQPLSEDHRVRGAQEVGRALAKAIDSTQGGLIRAMLLENPTGLHCEEAEIWKLGSRLALLATGDVEAGVATIAAENDLIDRSLFQLLSNDEIRDFHSFSFSEAYLELRAAIDVGLAK